MKKISILFMLLVVLTLGITAPTTHANMSVDVLYSETDLGSGLWQYDFTIENTSSSAYLWNVSLDFENYAYVSLLNNPANWSVGTFTGSLPDITDYLEMYSDAMAYDVLPGTLLAGLSLTADYQLGEILYGAVFSDHGSPEDWTTVSGTASPTPIPGTILLLGTGLAGLVGFHRKKV